VKNAVFSIAFGASVASTIAAMFAVVSVFTLIAVAIEAILRYWAKRPVFSLSRRPTEFREHTFGKGSWLLSEELASLRDSSFSSCHWTEMKEWGHFKRNLRPTLEDAGLTPLDVKRRLYQVDYSRSEFSILGGERTTTDQPSDAVDEILCFGGSTTFSMEVADRATWCSVLQRLIVDEVNDSRYRVRNCGVPGALGLERIQTMFEDYEIKPGSIVIFLIGDNDSGWHQVHGKWSQSFLPQPRGTETYVAPLYLRIVLRLATVSELAAWIYGEVSPAYLKRSAIRASLEMTKASEAVDDFAKARGARALFVLQPNIFTLATPDGWDSKIIRGTAKDLRIMILAAYARYREWTTKFSSAVDATNIFDSESPSPYMGDWAHYNTRGNELIGQFIFKELKSRGWLSTMKSLIRE